MDKAAESRLKAESVESGLEVKPSTSLEVAPQPDGNMYYVGGGKSDDPVFAQPDQSVQSQAKRKGRSRAIWVFAITAIVGLAVALGAGLRAGLAAQHKSNSSSGARATGYNSSSVPVTVIQASEAPVTITRSGNATTPLPSPTTLPSPSCPAVNGSTYTATNKPLPTISPQGWDWQIPNTTLSFKIFCNTNFDDEGPVKDIQVIENVSSLNDCLDQCALYNFRTRRDHFPALGCTGIAWDWGLFELCWLKSNVTLESRNSTVTLPGADGAVLLDV